MRRVRARCDGDGDVMMQEGGINDMCDGEGSQMARLMEAVGDVNMDLDRDEWGVAEVLESVLGRVERGSRYHSRGKSSGTARAKTGNGKASDGCENCEHGAEAMAVALKQRE